jgi:hypothetical protein
MLSAANPIMARLTANMPAGTKLFLSATLAAASKNANFAPAVHLVFDGIKPGQNLGMGKIQGVEIRWLLMIVDRNVSDAQSGWPALESASTLTKAVLDALLGFKPDSNHTPLVLATAPRHSENTGLAWMPLAFTTNTTWRGV